MNILDRKLNEVLENVDAYVDEINRVLPKRQDTKVYARQVECAVKALMMFNANKPRPNHIIIKAFTQGGKTGVFVAMIRLIDILQLSTTMGLKKIYCVTGDNTRSLKDQTLSRVQKCFHDEFCTLYVLKNSDMQKELKANKSEVLKNSLIFIDESHYGSNDDSKVLNRWLTSIGRDLKNTKALLEDSVYIISNSATPYNEMYANLAGTKAVVGLEVDPWNEETKSGYVGFEEFYKNGAFVDRVRQVNTRNMTSIESMVVEWREHIDEVKRTTGKDKCALVRIPERATFLKVKPVLEKYFEVEPFDGKDSNVDYATMEQHMHGACGAYDKPLMFVVQGAYRQGRTIGQGWEGCRAKQNICVVYEYASECYTTEQGLLGRLTGYTKSDDWKDVRFWINPNHVASLKEAYVEHKHSTPVSTSNCKVFVPNVNGNDFGFTNTIDEPLTYNDVPKFSGDEFTKDVIEYLEGLDPTYKDFEFIQSRRNKGKHRFDRPTFSYDTMFKHAKKRAEEIKAKPLGTDCYYFLYDHDLDTIQVMLCKTCMGDFKLRSEVKHKTYEVYVTTLDDEE